LISLVIALALVLAAELPTVTGQTGRITVALDSDIPTLDPHMHAARVAIIVERHIYDALFDRDPTTMKIVPGLAQSFRSINDLTWEVRLREGIRFQNGEPLTAEAVKFSIERVLNPAQKSPIRGDYTAIKSVTVIDPLTVQITTEKPYPLFLERFHALRILPPRHAKAVGDEFLANKPVGTGPYRLVEWVKDERIVLEADPRHWRGPASIKTVIFRPIPEQATQIAELRAGGVDIVPAIPPDQLPRLRADSNLKLDSSPILRMVLISFLREGPLADRRVRQALAHATDVDGIITHVLRGEAVRTPSGLTPLHFGFDKDVKGYPYDVRKAKALLTEAGYPNGFEITMNATASRIINAREIVEAILGQWAQVGVKVKLNFYPEVGPFLRLWPEKKAGPIAFWSWGSFSVFDADALFHPLLHCGELYVLYCDQRIDTMLDKARGTLDATERRTLYSQVQRMLVDEAGWIPLFSQRISAAMRKQVQWKVRADEIIWLYEASLSPR